MTDAPYWRAITLWQPWASLWCSGIKKHETRSWPTAYQGWLLVHAANRKVAQYLPADLEVIAARRFGEAFRETLPRGAIVGAVWLTGCDFVDGNFYETEDFKCGNYATGRFAWSAEKHTLYSEPISYKGKQGFFRVPVSVVPLGEVAA